MLDQRVRSKLGCGDHSPRTSTPIACAHTRTMTPTTSASRNSWRRMKHDAAAWSSELSSPQVLKMVNSGERSRIRSHLLSSAWLYKHRLYGWSALAHSRLFTPGAD